jgi:translocation and assembly module TamB
MRRLRAVFFSALAVALVFVISVVAGVLLLNLPAARRLTMRELNLFFASEFEGKLVIEHIENLRLDRADGIDVRISGADGTTLVIARGVRGRIAPLALIRSILRGSGDLHIDVFDIGVQSVDINLDADEGGTLKLESAFELRKPSTAKGAERPLRLALHDVAVHHALAHGHPRGWPPIAADVDGLRGATVRVDGRRVTVDTPHASFVGHGMPQGMDPRGEIGGRIFVPSQSGRPFGLVASFTGDVGDIPASAAAAFDGTSLDATLDVPEVSDGRVRALFPQAPIHRPVTVHAEAHGPLANLRTTVNATAGATELQSGADVRIDGPFGATIDFALRNVDLRDLWPSAPRSWLDMHAKAQVEQSRDGTVRGHFTADVTGGTSGPVSGNGAFTIQGSVALGPMPSFDATIAGRVEDVSLPFTSVRRGQLTAHTFGSFEAPHVDVTLDADAVRVAHYRFHHARVAAAGPLTAERVTVSLLGDGEAVRASATVALGEAPTVEHLQLDMSRGTEAVHATAARVNIQPEGISVAEAVITGIGEAIRGSLDARGESVVVQAGSKGVDLRALGFLLGAEDTLRSGRLAFAIDLSARRDRADGSATVDLSGGCFGSLEVSGHVDAKMTGRNVHGALNVSAGDVGTLDLSQVNLEIGGKGPLAAGSWRRTWGQVQVRGKVDLAKVADRLPPGLLPISRIAGRLTLEGHIRRGDEADKSPDGTFALRTYGLSVAPGNLSGIDVQVDLRADRDGSAEVAARLTDKDGPLVSLDAKSAAAFFERLFESRKSAVAALEDVVFSAVLVVPPRKLDHLPDLFAVAGAKGEVEGRVEIDGTYRKPKVDAKVTAHAVQFDGSALPGPLDADVSATYDGEASDIVLDVNSGTTRALHASARVNARLGDVLAPPAGAVPWDASAKATFTRFPLGALAAASDPRLTGQACGVIELTGLHRDARATVDLSLANPGVGGETFDTGSVKVVIDSHSLEASAQVERVGAEARMTTTAATTWGKKWIPSLDPSGAFSAAFQSTHFPAAVLAPLLEGVVDELGGMIDADAHLAFGPNEKPTLDGTIVLSDGLVEVTALGQEIHGVQATVVFVPNGIVRLDHLSASGTSGTLTASGAAYLDGLHLTRAEGVVRIPKGSAIPISLEGAAMGSAYGEFHLNAAASPDHGTAHVTIDVPTLHVDLPEAPTHSVQKLAEAPPQTHVGVYTSEGKFMLLPIDGADANAQRHGPRTPWSAPTVDVHLGKDVEIRRGLGLKIDLDGDLTAKLGDPTAVTGQVHLKGGTLDVREKSFEIESGTVTFLGDPSNPEVRVTASWTAEDGTRVYADFIGPLKSGKVILRSEPPRPQNEILALILFGNANGLEPATAAGGGQTDSTTKAGAAVSGFATAGLTQGLNKLTGLEITAKIDTSGANARPEVAIQIAKDISLQLAVVLGALPLGVNQDTTYAIVNWRFFRSWSLETTFGNQGTSIADVLWQHRY